MPSPAGLSVLTISAARSDRVCQIQGPAKTLASSMTFRLASGALTKSAQASDLLGACCESVENKLCRQ